MGGGTSIAQGKEVAERYRECLPVCFHGELWTFSSRNAEARANIAEILSGGGNFHTRSGSMILGCTGYHNSGQDAPKSGNSSNSERVEERKKATSCGLAQR